MREDVVKNVMKLVLGLGLVLVFSGFSCDKKTTVEGNKAPTVDAGTDKSVEVNTQVTITGTASDSDGTIASIEWTGNGSFLADTLSFDYTPTTTGTHTLTLTVMDDDGAIASDTMIVTVNNPPAVNNPPTANAGANKSVEVHHTVTIIGSGTDSDGTIASYEWTESGSFLADTATFDYTPNTTGGRTLMLTVTDDDGATATDTMVVTSTATPPPVNTPPVWTQTEYDGNRIHDGFDNVQEILDLAGKASDANGDTITYSYEKIVSVPAELDLWKTVNFYISNGKVYVSGLQTKNPGISGDVVIEISAYDGKIKTLTKIRVPFDNI